MDHETRVGLCVRIDRSFGELKRSLVDQLERAYLERCLAECSSVSHVSRTSGLSRKHVRTLLTKHGLRAAK